MATASMINSRLRMVFYAGEDVLTGKPIYKTKTFNLQEDATDKEIYDVAEALQSLQQRSLYNVERVDKFEIRKA
ncbi:DUF1659 domain-containing protein [Cerasibacillus terrae]|uniref:DUF1659 domain-containing protein n=1 Tax=Cerasibacillus terrae TaxID=2498845 RepID=A0A5C8NZH8_9BACI|nr:DUF1659 domain-containing protein [Cerasibacillus terrae]TXL66690.1 DUF1659 domain-containing protein [Cerasibacillus terrae]